MLKWKEHNALTAVNEYIFGPSSLFLPTLFPEQIRIQRYLSLKDLLFSFLFL